MKKLIGLGGCGTNVINYMVENNQFENCERITINDNVSVSKNSKAEKKIVIGSSLDTSIVELLHDCTRLCVVSGLGGNTSVKYLSQLALICEKAGIDVSYIVVTPFKIEGKAKQELASSVFKSLIDISNDVIVLSNDDYLPTAPSSQRPIKDIFNAANEEIITILTKIQSQNLMTHFNRY
jgi:cell division GTPase FtsZ